MADKMKLDFYVPVSRQVALHNKSHRNGARSQIFDEEAIFIFFLW